MLLKQRVHHYEVLAFPVLSKHAIMQLKRRFKQCSRYVTETMNARATPAQKLTYILCRHITSQWKMITKEYLNNTSNS